MAQIEKSKPEPLTLEHFKEELNKGLWEQLNYDNKREFVIHTGSRGYQMFQDQLQRSVLLAMLEDISAYFTAEEMVRIKEMINSEDVENMTVASAIIDFKLKLSNQIPNQDVSNIQTGESQLPEPGSQ